MSRSTTARCPLSGRGSRSHSNTKDSSANSGSATGAVRTRRAAGGRAAFDVVGDLVADLRQLRELRLDHGVARVGSEFAVFGRLLAQIVVVIHVTPHVT